MSLSKLLLEESEPTAVSRTFEVEFKLWPAGQKEGAEPVDLGVMDIEHTGTTESRVAFFSDIQQAVRMVAERHGAKCDTAR